jgi:23S rRNA (uracil1939-C5)-methyltransferase
MAPEVTVRVDSMAHRGYGVARLMEKVIFIPYTAPGESVSITITEEKKNYSIGQALKILEPSPVRREPPCPYFGTCGGCQWQHIDYSAHGVLKATILGDILKRLGGFREIPTVAVHPSPRPYGYRVRVQLKRRGTDLGYYRERSHQIIDIDHCPIAHRLINEIIPVLRRNLSRLSAVKEIEINVSPEEANGVLLLHVDSYESKTRKFLSDLLGAYPILKGVAILQRGGIKRVGDPVLTFPVLLLRSGEERRLHFRASAGSFFQVHPDQNQRLVQSVLDFSGPSENEKVLDLYAGIGNFTIPLALEAGEAIGIEESPPAIRDAAFNSRSNGVERCRFIAAKVEDVLKTWKEENPQLIVLDPPRTGAKGLTERISGIRPERIVYVSCEPTTFARDIRLLSEKGYRLERLALIDMFPQSYHMEVVGLLKH